ncbi:MAG: cupredoxin domain-containing protein [Acidimicrobiales bacterium]
MRGTLAGRIMAGSFVVAAVAVGGLACSKSDSSATTSSTASSSTTAAPVNQGAAITAKEFAFDPTPQSVKKGETITWTNDGASTHQVQAEPDASGQKLFASKPLAPGDTFVTTIAEPGTYNYICVIHPERMQGQIVVTP